MTRSATARASLLRGITRNVVILGLVSLLTDVSSELLIYVVPLFLANVLAATPTVIGVIEGIAESLGAIVKLASGALSDRVGRRTILVGSGYATSVAAKALFLIATAWPVVLAARVGDRLGKGIRTAPRDALIADSTPAESRGRAFGLHRAMDTTGAVIGVALAAVIVGLAQGDASRLEPGTFRTLVLAALVPGALAVLVVAGWVRDVPRAQAVPRPAPSAAATPVRHVGRFPAPFWFFVAATGLFTLGNSSEAFVALRIQDVGVSVRDLMLVIVAFNLVDVVVAWPVGSLSDRVGRRRLIALAWGLYAATYAGLAIASDPVAVVPVVLLYGAYYGVNEAVGRALVADLAAPELRATAYGIVNLVTGLALLPASVVAGLLWDGVGPSAPFWFGALCALGGLGLLAFVRPDRVAPGAAAAAGTQDAAPAAGA